MMGAHYDSVYGAAVSIGNRATLVGVAAGIALTQFALQSEAGVGENLVAVGLPILLGAAVANAVMPPSGKAEKVTKYAERGALAGGVGTAAMMAAGAMPVIFDIQTLAFVGLVGGSVIIGDMYTSAIAPS